MQGQSKIVFADKKSKNSVLESTHFLNEESSYMPVNDIFVI